MSALDTLWMFDCFSRMERHATLAFYLVVCLDLRYTVPVVYILADSYTELRYVYSAWPLNLCRLQVGRARQVVDRNLPPDQCHQKLKEQRVARRRSLPSALTLMTNQMIVVQPEDLNQWAAVQKGILFPLPHRFCPLNCCVISIFFHSGRASP